MSKQTKADPPQPGDLTYLHEKLGQAIDGAMFADTPEAIASVFEVLSRAINDREGWDQSPYVKGYPEAEKWFRRIKEMITPSMEDEGDPAAAAQGTWWVLARRMTTDDKRELARCMSELYHHVGSVGPD